MKLFFDKINWYSCSSITVWVHWNQVAKRLKKERQTDPSLHELQFTWTLADKHIVILADKHISNSSSISES